MINTRYMKKIAFYKYYGIIETAYQQGKYYYISIIDQRKKQSNAKYIVNKRINTRLSNAYDKLGVRRVSYKYIEDWIEYRAKYIQDWIKLGSNG